MLLFLLLLLLLFTVDIAIAVAILIAAIVIALAIAKRQSWLCVVLALVVSARQNSEVSTFYCFNCFVAFIVSIVSIISIALAIFDNCVGKRSTNRFIFSREQSYRCVIQVFRSLFSKKERSIHGLLLLFIHF